MFNNVKRILDKSTALGVPCSEILIFLDGREVFHDVRGVRDSNGAPLAANERFNIYSCSKPITCAAALMLFEEGKISLNDDLAEYIPSFGDLKVSKNGGIFKAENKIKLQQLFTMTAGLTYDLESSEIRRGMLETNGVCPTVKMMDYIAAMPLAFEPGESWNYSLCHDVIAAVVEIVSGKRFGEYVSEKIFAPLGMTSSTFLLPESEVDSLPEQYLAKPDGSLQGIGKHIHRYKIGSAYESGGAGCVTTACDYIKFLEGMRTGKLLSRETLKIMYHDHLNKAQRASCWAPNAYGYGLGVRVPDASGRRTDIGWGGAAGAYLALDEKNGISLYYNQHVLHSPNKNLRKDLIEAAKLDLEFEAFTEDMYHGEASHLA